MRRSWSLGVLLLLFGCGDAPTPAPSCPTGQATGADDLCVPMGIQGCASIFLEADGLCHPAMEKCPAGTIPKFDEGCVPVGIGGCAPAFVGADGLCRPTMSACASGELALPDEGCVPLDGPGGCGDAPWGSIADAPGTVWIDPQAPSGGDGSRTNPVRTIAEGTAKVAKGGRLALAAGEYAEPLLLDKVREVVGRCASLVRIGGTTEFAGAPTVAFASSTFAPDVVTIRGVTLSGPGTGLITDAHVVLERVRIEGSEGFGIAAIGKSSVIELDHSFVGRTAWLTSDYPGRGVLALKGATVKVRSSVFLENHDMGLYLSDSGTTLSLERSLVEGTLPEGGKMARGRGIELNEGAVGTLTLAAIVGNHESGVFTEDVGTRVTIVDSVIADTRPEPTENSYGYGIHVSVGVDASISGSALVGNHGAGILAGGKGATLGVERTLVAESKPHLATDADGVGLYLLAGAEAHVAASAFDRNRLQSVVVLDGSNLVLEQSLISRTAAGADGRHGRGLVVDTLGRAAIRASALVDNREGGVLALAGKALDLDESLVERTWPNADGSYGVGIGCSQTPSLTIRRTLVRDSHTAGILASSLCQVTLEDAGIEGVSAGKFYEFGENGAPTKSYDGVGDGFVVAFGASAYASGLVVKGAPRASIVVDSAKGRLERVRAEGAAFGLVLQGAPELEVADDGSRYEGTSEDIVSDVNLPVPSEPSIPLQ